MQCLRGLVPTVCTLNTSYLPILPSAWLPIRGCFPPREREAQLKDGTRRCCMDSRGGGEGDSEDNWQGLCHVSCGCPWCTVTARISTAALPLPRSTVSNDVVFTQQLRVLDTTPDADTCATSRRRTLRRCPLQPRHSELRTH